MVVSVHDWSVRASFLLETKAAPLAGRGAVNVSLVQLDVLHRVAQAELVHAHATGSVAVNLDDGHRVDQLLGVRTVGGG